MTLRIENEVTHKIYDFENLTDRQDSRLFYHFDITLFEGMDDGIYDASMRLLLGGYSLAGLFALWTAYQTDAFDGIAAASPSVWYPQWIDYASEKRPLVKSIYLSLGDKEDKARNPVMAQVGKAIRKQHELLSGQEINTILEWNAGNHFVDSEKRMAQGFAWLLNNLI